VVIWVKLAIIDAMITLSGDEDVIS